MKVVFTGKNMSLSEGLERYIIEKFGRLARHEPNLERVDVELTQQATRDVQDHYVCQANLIISGRLMLRGEERAADPYVAIDTLVDSLENRLTQLHERWESRRRPTAQGHLPPTPPEAVVEPSTLEAVLSDYDVDQATIIHLEEHGIRTMEQLKALVEDGTLRTRLGPGYGHQARELEKVIEKLRL